MRQQNSEPLGSNFRSGQKWPGRRKRFGPQLSATSNFWPLRKPASTDRPDGEDRFDSVVALFSTLDVVLGHRSEGTPDDADVRSVEGWILGQAP